MKYIKPYMIKESIFKDIDSAIDEVEGLEKKQKEIEERIDRLKNDLNSKYLDKIANSINKCLDIMVDIWGEEYDLVYGIDEELLYEKLGIHYQIEKIIGFSYYIEQTDGGKGWAFYNTFSEHQVPFTSLDVFRLYKVLKILVSIPEVSKAMNLNTIINLNK